MTSDPKTGPGPTHWFTTTEAREKISKIILLAQDPRAAVILTRHGKPVAAVVSMADLRRISHQHEVEDISVHRERKMVHMFGPMKLGARTIAEAGEKIQQLQLDRLAEREVLRHAGLPVVQGGELEQVVETRVKAPRWRWWAWVRRR